jgi:dephospho-CoA kinase
MLIVGLTGGIASGKSTVTRFFAEIGARTIDLDALSRIVVESGRPARQEIVEHFGQKVLKPDGSLDRQKLGEIVFQDERSRRILEAIVHPRVLEEQERAVRVIRARDPRAVVVCDVPLLIEIGLHKKVDGVILVYIPESLQIQRLVERDGLTLDAAEKRLRSQMPIDRKRSYADFVIDNSGDLTDTRRQTVAVMGRLRELERRRRKSSRN